jgi:hypothetical protein
MANDATGARFGELYGLACAFAARIDLDELMPLVVAECRRALDAEGASVLLLDPGTNELYFEATADDPAVAARLRGLRLPADRVIAGAVLQSGSPVRVDDVATDPRFYAAVDRQTGFTTRSLLCAPLRTAAGTIGVVQVVNRRGGGTFSDTDLRLLEAMAGSIAVAFDNARAFARVRESQARLEMQLVAPRRDLGRRDHFADIVGGSAAMREVFRLMESAAAAPIAVSIEGETGTGKELVARAIHRASPRADGPFVPVNCAAIPETLLERELFGHRRGAFTGATHDQRGFFAAADGGTIFLDEIGEMPFAMQAKLLRVLQEGEFTPLGDTRPQRIDVRVLSATNRNLLADGATSTTGSAPFRSSSRRCASGGTTFRGSCSIASSSRARDSAAPSRASSRTRSKCSSVPSGAATSASSRTRSSVRWPSRPKARPSGASVSRGGSPRLARPHRLRPRRRPTTRPRYATRAHGGKPTTSHGRSRAHTATCPTPRARSASRAPCCNAS